MVPVLAQLRDLHAEALEPAGDAVGLPLGYRPDLGIGSTGDGAVVLAEQLLQKVVNRPFALGHIGNDDHVGGRLAALFRSPGVRAPRVRAVAGALRRGVGGSQQREQKRQQRHLAKAAGAPVGPNDGVRHDRTLEWQA